jgi:3-methylcrotonyl-CoA carboxylase alpha subunit
MFRKILIANRGEIAFRIIATCREMGVQTVAVYSDADRNARHVREADEAYYIGPAPAIQSYLSIDTIIDIAKRSNVQAIHPGYGFLAENATFVEACEQARIVFIGPPASAMRLMGSKIAAKQLAQSVNVPTVPGYNGESQDDSMLMREAKLIGFPLLIKASAGGGGKGMREVYTAADFPGQLAGARREAQAAFGNATVFLERLLQQPRHIEIQVLGDEFGNIIHLGERECSIQRRHQKIVEESPSVALTPALRAEMGKAAVRLAKAAGYVNAGTIEFMLDSDKRFYFLEMNARLQVEHPVTELVTGIDLVRHQLLIAAGQPLSLSQEQISQRGHAIEMRLYAEDPAQNFLPSTGIITRFILPTGPGVRVDSGIASGDEITQFYDPMIAKLIVYGEDRSAAIARVQSSLEQCIVFGVNTNASLLHAIATHPAFQDGYTHTGFLGVYGLASEDNTTPGLPLPHAVLIAAALCDTTGDVAAHSAQNHHARPADTTSTNPWHTLGPWRMVGEAQRMTYSYQGEEHSVTIRPLQDSTVAGVWSIQVDTHPAENVSCIFGNDDLILLRQGAKQLRTYVQHVEGEIQVFLHGQMYHLARRQPPNVDLAAHAVAGTIARSQKVLAAPMAGTIVKIQVHDGETVQQRQLLAVLSAMKMEHSIIAPYAGKVRHIYYQEGDVVKGGAVIVEME